MHPLYAFMPDGTPLGTVHAKAWVRPDKSDARESEPPVDRKQIPIGEKKVSGPFSGQKRVLTRMALS